MLAVEIAGKLDPDLRQILSALVGIPRQDAEIALVLVRRGTLEALAALDIVEIDGEDTLIGPVDAVRVTDRGAAVISACAELAPASDTQLTRDEFHRRVLGDAHTDVRFALSGGRRERS
ncbi:hypothetical protein C8N24_0191 [Solirubrobacter pauli]|uniref:Uncharacterized protein n=1 Tax=Solirubrobacter pauli TaxID=166793 RepID=A0A660L7C1_9ACTN|nr:hypothetical protein [Solirubrobacter pauli]RKQ90389.1 hypothetical protein C8N24_0191 [Solirubrobacter pauli]